MNEGAGEVVVSARGLHKTFALGFFRKKVTAVEDVSFDVRRGEIFGFLGPNGSGKTTTIKLMLGMSEADDGRIEVLGHQIPREAPRALARIGYVPENVHLYASLTVGEFREWLLGDGAAGSSAGTSDSAAICGFRRGEAGAIPGPSKTRRSGECASVGVPQRGACAR